MNDKMRDALKGLLSLLEQNLRGNDDDDVCLEIRLAREALAHPEHPEHHGAVSGWYCAHCQQGVDPVDVTFGETHVYCGRPVKDCPAPPAPVVPERWPQKFAALCARVEDIAWHLAKLADALGESGTVSSHYVAGTATQLRHALDAAIDEGMLAAAGAAQ